MTAEPRYWEPWEPEVGQRVRVTVHSECRVAPMRGSALYAISGRGHLESEHGVTGTVIGLRAPTHLLGAQGHRFRVEFDHPVVVGKRACYRSSYAAVELEPLDGAP